MSVCCRAHVSRSLSSGAFCHAHVSRWLGSGPDGAQLPAGGRLQAEQLPENDAERVDVGGLGGRAACDDLRGSASIVSCQSMVASLARNISMAARAQCG